MEINPRIVFERLFGDGSSAAERLARKQEDRSILDSVTQETSHLQSGLGARDKQRIGEYLENVREIERRIQKAEKQASNNLAMPETPIGVPESFDEHAKLMFDLQALAYQADITRIRPSCWRAISASALSRKSASPNRTTPLRITATTPRRLRSLRKSTTIIIHCWLTSSRNCKPLRTAMARCSITR